MHRKHDYSVRLFDETDVFVERFEGSGRIYIDTRVKDALTTHKAAWARIYNHTLSKRVDRWKRSKDTAAMEMLRGD